MSSSRRLRFLWDIYSGVRELRKPPTSPLSPFPEQFNKQIKQPYNDNTIENPNEPSAVSPPSSKEIGLCIEQQERKNSTNQSTQPLNIEGLGAYTLNEVVNTENKESGKTDKYEPSYPRIVINKLFNQGKYNNYYNCDYNPQPDVAITTTASPTSSRHITQLISLLRRIINRFRRAVNHNRGEPRLKLMVVRCAVNRAIIYMC